MPHTRDRDDALRNYIKSRSWRIKDVMSSPVVVATPTTTAAQLADLLLAHDIKHIPVVNAGKLIGIISRRDLVSGLLDVPADCTASGDEALLKAVRSRLESELDITPRDVETTVADGVITLRGKLESEIESEAARVAAESVRGVAGVVTEISVAFHMVSRFKPSV